MAIRVKIGAVLAKSSRQVAPCMVFALKTPIIHLLAHGCSNGLIQDSKLRHALSKSLKGNKELLAGWPLTVALPELCKHFAAVLGMIRAFARENLEGGRGRRFPRSGGFRRKCQMHDFDMMEQMCSTLSLDSCQGDVSGDEGATTMAESNGDDFPSCFAVPSAGVVSSRDVPANDHDWPSFCLPAASPPVSPTADGWPKFCSPAPSPPLPPIADDPAEAIPRIDPVAASRKRAAHDCNPVDVVEPRRKAKKQCSSAVVETPPKAKKPCSSSSTENPLYFKPLLKCFCTHTAEHVPRSQLTGIAAGTRIHIVTLRESSFGPRFLELAEELQTCILKWKLSRKEAEATIAKHRLA